MEHSNHFKTKLRHLPEQEVIFKRIQHFHEFENTLAPEATQHEAKRCMDCAIPFCHGESSVLAEPDPQQAIGCPVKNKIPEFNALVAENKWQAALENLHSTNNFPEFTGKLCPAPCESACTLEPTFGSVSIKNIELSIIEQGFKNNWVSVTTKAKRLTQTKKIAIVGGGPAGLACAQELNRAGHDVTVYDKHSQMGGLLRLGIPDFKLEKKIIDRRLQQLSAEGVLFKNNAYVGHNVSTFDLYQEHDALILAGGCELPRDLNIPGRDLKGVEFALDYLIAQNKYTSGVIAAIPEALNARNKHVVIIGGGDTGSDCVGTAVRQGAKSIKQLEISPIPGKARTEQFPWPLMPKIFKTSSSQEEGGERLFAVETCQFLGNSGILQSINGRSKLNQKEWTWPADLVLLALGFNGYPQRGLLADLQQIGLKLDERGKISSNQFQTNLPKVFVCGDMRRGQSLIVWAIAEGRECAQAVQKYGERAEENRLVAEHLP